MRYLRWIGLMSSLLIVGVLGALVALPSEAAVVAPSLVEIRLKADGADVLIPKTLQTTCSNTAYDFCYRITPGTYGACSTCSPKRYGWQISDISGSTALLLIADRTGGTNNPDIITFSGMTIKPGLGTPSTPTLSHSATFEIKVKLDSSGSTTTTRNTNTFNVNPVAPYQIAFRVYGNFLATNDPCQTLTQSTPCANYPNTLQLSGTGKFCTFGTNCGSFLNVDVPIRNTANPDTILKGQDGSRSTSSTSTSTLKNKLNGGSLSHIQTYPQMPSATVNCNTGPVPGLSGNQCAPLITATLNIVDYGLDTLFETNSVDTVASQCDETAPTGQGAHDPAFNRGKKDGEPQVQEVPCVSTTNSINRFFKDFDDADKGSTPPDTPPGLACVENPNTVEIECPCDDPALNADGSTICPGGITVVEIVDGLTGGKATTFSFSGSGDGIPPSFTFDIKKDQGGGGTGVAQTTFDSLTDEYLGGSRSVRQIGPGTPYDVKCESSRQDQNSTFLYETSSGATSIDTAIVRNLGPDDHVTCTFKTSL